MNSINGFSTEIEKIKKIVNDADAVLIGAGSGLSTSAGYTYSGKRFHDNFHDFESKYNFHDMYSGGFYPFPSSEEKWAYWSRYIYINRYSDIIGNAYKYLFKTVENKDYFVITTNVDHCFQRSGFDKERLFYTQGDYGLFQCSLPCHKKTYDNEESVKKMYFSQKDMKIPTELIPKCPVCGREMSMNLRSDDTFVENECFYDAYEKYEKFIEKHKKDHIVYLELGVGGNTPVIIKYPFWQMTLKNPNSFYICINLGEAYCPDNISSRSICINDDIEETLKKISQ